MYMCKFYYIYLSNHVQFKKFEFCLNSNGISNFSKNF